MLPLVALSLAVLFFVMLRSGILDDLANEMRGDRSPSRRATGKLPAPEDDPEVSKRLEVFKDFLEGDEEQED